MSLYTQNNFIIMYTNSTNHFSWKYTLFPMINDIKRIQVSPTYKVTQAIRSLGRSFLRAKWFSLKVSLNNLVVLENSFAQLLTLLLCLVACPLVSWACFQRSFNDQINRDFHTDHQPIRSLGRSLKKWLVLVVTL